MSWSQQPSCFGKLWDAQNPECAGGADAAYRDKAGGHIRERCAFFEQCGATKQATTQTTTQQTIPVQNLSQPFRPYGYLTSTTSTNTLKPTAPSTPTTTGLPATATPQQLATTNATITQQAQLIQQLTQQIAQLQRGMAQPVSPPMPLATGYQQMMPVNFAMPQYLSVREEIPEDGSIWGALGREVARSMGKSFGHTLANFFDVTPFRRK